MGKINVERKIHFRYTPLVRYWWSKQTEEFKQACGEAGEPYGYSAMNVWYLIIIMEIAINRGGCEWKDFEKSNG